MREGVILGAHPMRYHGVKIAWTHLYDWLMLMLLGVILTVLNIIHPFDRFVGKGMMTDLKYPHTSGTIPFMAVPVYSVLLPILVFLIFYCRQRNSYDLHHAILGLLFSCLITAVLTDATKITVGRPRPDFFWRCFPDGIDVYDEWGNVVCHGKARVIREGRKSFPSGHTSWSFSGLTFLSLYLAGKIKAFDGKGHIAKLCAVLLPLLCACLVGISRVDDYRHHWQDVVAGGLLGLLVATIFYLQFFPPPYHIDGWRTYAYLRMLDELRPNTCDGGEVEIQQVGERNSNLGSRDCPPISSSRRSPADLEAGGR